MFIWTFFDHKDLENHLLQLCPKVVKHPLWFVVAGELSVANIRKRLKIYYRAKRKTGCLQKCVRPSWRVNATLQGEPHSSSLTPALISRKPPLLCRDWTAQCWIQPRMKGEDAFVLHDNTSQHASLRAMQTITKLRQTVAPSAIQLGYGPIRFPSSCSTEERHSPTEV
jgi:hypothetical protein